MASQLLDQLKKLLPILSDLLRQLQRHIQISLEILERHNRAFEELDSIRLWFEKFEATQRELIEELALGRDSDNFWRKRLEQLALANYAKDTRAVEYITTQITSEHLRDRLREELASCQGRLLDYQRNVTRTKERVAKQGYPTIEQQNQVDDWQREIEKLNEAIERIRQELK